MSFSEVYIIGKSAICSLGNNDETIWENLNSDSPILKLNSNNFPIAAIPNELEKQLESLKQENKTYKRADRSVLLAILCARDLIASNTWEDTTNVAVNIASSRGATGLFEETHRQFIEHPNRVSPFTSPSTTLGNISSSVAMEIHATSYAESHSITCSSALHGLLNACAWLNSGMATQFIVGGAEAPLTDYTIAQMQALKIYSPKTAGWLSTPLLKGNTQNTMVLGEGAALFALQKQPHKNALAKIIGVGYAVEHYSNSTTLSASGNSLKLSMQSALKTAEQDTVDVLIMHAPGTILGDSAEIAAAKEVFGNNLPQLVSTKHKTAHTLGASGGLSA